MKINVEGKGGDDSLWANFGRKHGGTLELTADLGAGNDGADVRMLGNLSGGADVTFKLLGDVGNDSFYVLAFPNTSSGEGVGIDLADDTEFTIDLDGGEDADWIHTIYVGEADGDLSITTRGGTEADDLSVIANLRSASNGDVFVETSGNAGDDELRHEVWYAAGASLSGSLNGGSGFDTGQKTANVSHAGIEILTIVT
jgi:hypothetical protein